MLKQRRCGHNGWKPGRGRMGADGFIVGESLMSIHGTKERKSAVRVPACDQTRPVVYSMPACCYAEKGWGRGGW